MSERTLIVNADDFGASPGINRGVIEAHTDGILTSASLMVDAPAAQEAVTLAAEHPSLGLGLHWDLDSGPDGPHVDLEDSAAVERVLAGQLERFQELVGRPPTHLDSHHHVHRQPVVGPLARRLAEPLRRPLREDGRVAYVGGFYGQWEWRVTDLSHVSVEFLIWILRNEVDVGWTEIGCHPGYISQGFTSVYLDEREAELRTLTDPRVADEIDGLGIRLASYADYPS